MARIIVIGGGFGGLAAAIRLQAAGHQVCLVEAREQLGGRAGQIREAGYAFDMGPTIVTAPRLLTDIWAAARRNLRDYIELMPLRPWYEIRFRDGKRFAYGGDSGSSNAAMETEIAKFDPAAVAGYRRFMEKTGAIYQRGFGQLARKPFLSVTDFLRVMPELVLMGAHRSVFDFVSGYIRDEHLRVVLSFHPLFIGGDPFKASAIYSIVPYLEREDGVWFVRGGTFSLVEAMGRLLEELGGEITRGDPVVEILIRNGRAAGVRLQQGHELAADAVVSNADVVETYTKMVPPRVRRRNSTTRYSRFAYSMSCFILYLGLDRQYPHLHHHTILMPRRYRDVVKGIFGGRLVENDLALYVNMPTRTDPGLAPAGGEALYALVPVPNLAGDLQWPEAGDRLRGKVVSLLREDLGMEDVERHIVVERRITPVDFRESLASHLGAGFSIEPTLRQSAYLRPHNRSEDVPGLYLVGAGTHPGAGLPGVLLSAEIAADLVATDMPARLGTRTVPT